MDTEQRSVGVPVTGQKEGGEDRRPTILRETSDIMLASAFGAVVAFVAAYITTAAGQQALMTAAATEHLTPIDVFAFSTLGIVFSALAARSFPVFEASEALFVSLASASLVEVILQNRRFKWIVYVPCMVPMLLLLWKLNRWLRRMLPRLVVVVEWLGREGSGNLDGGGGEELV